MKKHLSLLFLFSSLLQAAPANFPCATQVLTKVYDGTLSTSIAQEQPAIESYDVLYKAINNDNSDANLKTLLSDVQQKKTTPQAANALFSTYQSKVVSDTTTILSNQ